MKGCIGHFYGTGVSMFILFNVHVQLGANCFVLVLQYITHAVTEVTFETCTYGIVSLHPSAYTHYW